MRSPFFVTFILIDIQKLDSSHASKSIIILEMGWKNKNYVGGGGDGGAPGALSFSASADCAAD